MGTKNTLIIGGLFVLVVGLVVYLSIARALDERGPPLPLPSAPTRRADRAPDEVPPPQPCPRCPPAQKRPLFPKLHKPIEYSVDFFGMIWVGHSSNLIDEHILFFGAYEKDVLFLLRDLMKALGKDGGVFVDVGANTGQHSLFMSKYARAVHAFEPYEPVLERFRAALKRNAVSNVTVHPVGLGDKTALVPFHRPPVENLGSGSFVPNYQPGNRPSSSLRIVTGDEALAKAGVGRVDLLKIDVEGYEKLSLRGLLRTLERLRPVVVVEVTVSPQHQETFKTVDELRAAFPKGYVFLRVRQTARRAWSGEYQLVPFDLDFQRVGQHMLLAFPGERREALGLVTTR